MNEDSLNKDQKLKENPFKVPENYFKNSKLDLLAIADRETIAMEEKVEEPKVFHLSKFYAWAGVAAVFVISLFLFNIFNKTPVHTIESISNVEAENYLDETYFLGLAEEEIILSEIEYEALEDIAIMDEFSDEELDSYLDSETDIDLLDTYL